MFFLFKDSCLRALFFEKLKFMVFRPFFCGRSLDSISACKTDSISAPSNGQLFAPKLREAKTPEIPVFYSILAETVWKQGSDGRAKTRRLCTQWHFATTQRKVSRPPRPKGSFEKVAAHTCQLQKQSVLTLLISLVAHLWPNETIMLCKKIKQVDKKETLEAKRKELG